MSYDIYLRTRWVLCANPCEHCKQRDPETVYDWNYTTNMAGAWEAAGADLKGFDGRTAGECAPILRGAIAAMRADPARFASFEPSNGWGKIRTLLPALEQLATVCEEYPDCIVGVSR